MIDTTVGPDATVVSIRQRDNGAQGFSGATLRYYDVTYRLQGETNPITLVVKDAPLHERQTQMWLSAHGLPVPRCYALDLTTDAPAPLCMQCIAGTPTPEEQIRLAPHALAAIHYAAMGRSDALPWVPHTDAAFIARIVGYWREPWQAALNGSAAIRRYATQHGFTWDGGALGNDFAAAFANETPSLEAAAQQFAQTMCALYDAGDALTLLHADFHGAHVRVMGGKAYLIDWGQARYGPLYLDLPNYFPREADALRYRDALAALGYDIPRDAFLAGYNAARAYPGFKYFGFAFQQWFTGEPQHQQSAVQYWINMVRLGPDKSVWPRA